MTTVIVCLSSKSDDDGHSVLSYKHDHVVWTFQSFYNTCGFQFKRGDIFDKTSSLIKSLAEGRAVDATDVGSIISSEVSSNKVLIDVEICFYLEKQI